MQLYIILFTLFITFNVVINTLITKGDPKMDNDMNMNN